MRGLPLVALAALASAEDPNRCVSPVGDDHWSGILESKRADRGIYARNHIHDLFHSRIPVGSAWGYEPSVSADSLVAATDVDPDHDDLRLAPGSPVLALGFVPRDWSTVGIRPKDQR